MKVEVIAEKIFQAIYRAEKITGKNLSLPILGGILIEARSSNLIVKATNLDMGIELKIGSKVSKSGGVVVPGLAITNFLGSVQNEGKVSLETVDNSLILKTKRNRAVINTMNVADFPKLPVVPKKNKINLDTNALTKGLKSVSYSASISSMKPELSSIFVGNKGGVLLFAGTDSFRLAEKKIVVNKLTSFDSLLIPLKNVGEIIRNAELSGGKADLSFDENQLSIKFDDGTTLSSRVIDGVFPDYEQIIPKKFDTEAVILKQDLLDALKISNIFSNKFNQIVTKVEPNKKKFSIETSNPELGESVVALEAALSGEDVEIGFNHKYISDSLVSLDGDSVSLQFSGAGKPMVIKSTGDSSFTYLVMPMNR